MNGEVERQMIIKVEKRADNYYNKEVIVRLSEICSPEGYDNGICFFWILYFYSDIGSCILSDTFEVQMVGSSCRKSFVLLVFVSGIKTQVYTAYYTFLINLAV